MQQKYGQLLTPDIKLHRKWFREMVKLHGIYCVYRPPKEGKHWTTYAELESNYKQPTLIGCLFEEHPDQQTMKKIGWLSETATSSSIIHVDYDLPDIQVGALFIVPSGLDDGKGRLFRAVRLANSMVYPASMTVEIVPEYEDMIQPEKVYDFSNTNYNLLNIDDD